MTDTTDQQAVTVAQEDREAATLYWQSQDIGSPETYAQIRAGSRDDSHLIRAFARHRLASVSSASAETPDDVRAFVDSYEFRADDGDHTPTEAERALIEDAIHGYLDASPEPVPATNQAGEVERLRAALQHIEFEAGRENGGWAHLKRSIAVHARAALATQPATSQEGEALRKAFLETMQPLFLLETAEKLADKFIAKVSL